MTGIDDKAFDDMILKVYNIKEDLIILFNNLDSLVDALNNCYKSESGKNLINSYEAFSKSNFPIVLDNIGNYINDLKSAKENIQTFGAKLSLQFEEIE